jgi:hypothetical protein
LEQITVVTDPENSLFSEGTRPAKAFLQDLLPRAKQFGVTVRTSDSDFKHIHPRAKDYSSTQFATAYVEMLNNHLHQHYHQPNPPQAH